MTGTAAEFYLIARFLVLAGLFLFGCFYRSRVSRPNFSFYVVIMIAAAIIAGGWGVRLWVTASTARKLHNLRVDQVAEVDVNRRPVADPGEIVRGLNQSAWYASTPGSRSWWGESIASMAGTFGSMRIRLQSGEIYEFVLRDPPMQDAPMIRSNDSVVIESHGFGCLISQPLYYALHRIGAR